VSLHPLDQPIELQQLEPRLPCSVVVRLADGELQVTVADPEVVFKDAILSEENSGAPRAETSRETLATPFELAFDGGALEVIAFRSERETERPALPLAVLDAINAVRQSDTPTARAVLSDTLEGAGAVAEAEYVRVEAAAQAMEPSPAFVDALFRLRALSGVVGTTFRFLVGRDVDGCAGLRWSFRCPRQWSQMEKTSDPNVRSCAPCRQLVSMVHTEQEATQHAELGHCVSMASAGVDFVVGSVALVIPPRVREPTRPPEPKPPASWWERLLGRFGQ